MQEFLRERSPGYLTNVAARLFAKAFQKRLSAHGINLAQWPILMFLWEEEGLTQAELSRRVQIEDSTTVHNIDRMEKDGLVERVRDPKDRRQVRLYLTERGKSLRAPLLPLAVEVNEAATAGMEEADRRLFNRLLLQVIENLLADGN